jgi:nitroreductase
MTLDEIIRARKSVRKFEPKPVEKEKIEQILEAARLAPSACNAQPWRFVIVQSKTAREAVLKHGRLEEFFVSNKWATEAPVIIVACSKKELLVHSIAEKAQGVQYHLIDIGIACQQMVLKAQELGLGTCYIGWFNAKQIKKVLDLPSGLNPECLITLGYEADSEKNSDKRTPRKTLEEISLWK